MQRKIDFFQSASGQESSAASSIQEASVVEWMMTDEHLAKLILETLSLSSKAAVFREVRAPFIRSSNSKPGDIDLIAFERDAPHGGIAVEFKRVKVRTEESTELVTKLEGLQKAASQVRGLRGIGFARTYLGVIAVVDGRGARNENFIGRGLSDSTYRRVLDFAGTLRLPEDAGILYVEVVQPGDRPIVESGMLSAAVAKEARLSEQPALLTELLSRYGQ